MGSFRVTVGGATVRAKTFPDVRSAVARAITDLMALDPESVARDAMTVNLAMQIGGAAEHSLTAHGRWSATLTVAGESVPVVIVRKRW